MLPGRRLLQQDEINNAKTGKLRMQIYSTSTKAAQ